MTKKGYKLQYDGQWMEYVHMTGHDTYKLHYDPEDVPAYTREQAERLRSAICAENEISLSEITLVEAGEVADKPKKPRKDYFDEV